jgi:hypothetical protein
MSAIVVADVNLYKEVPQDSDDKYYPCIMNLNPNPNPSPNLNISKDEFECIKSGV